MTRALSGHVRTRGKQSRSKVRKHCKTQYKLKKPTLPDLVRTNGFSWRETGTLRPHNVVAAPFVFRTHSVVRSCSAHAILWTTCGPNPKSSVFAGFRGAQGTCLQTGILLRGYCCLGMSRTVFYCILLYLILYYTVFILYYTRLGARRLGSAYIIVYTARRGGSARLIL